MVDMDSKETLFVGVSSSAFVGVLAAIQVDDIMRWINLALAILSTLLSLAFTLWKWYRNAKKDGKISEDEIDDLVNTLEQGKESVTEIIEKEKKEDEKGN